MKKEITYPVYQKSKDCLYAFLAKDKMFKIEMRGTNVGNTGMAIDYYITRRMVIQHMGGSNQTITKEMFERLYNNLVNAMLHKMIY